ncbi:hypothetical protein L915_04080 [Phytophthora nicotianae]|uniref:Uncharacterized protein n=1 Tax=Phytophthora nicotianae TaxID=4792 RepID=W2HBR6_PHYNI|nr:hypothetical protein L915_04080 [Phytophthora nicotianae]
MVTIMIYDYGMEVVTAKDRVAFLKACILARETDRAGATAESSLREVVEALQQKWGGTFQASATVWRMWANRITRNLDRSTWAAEISCTYWIQLSPAWRRILQMLLSLPMLRWTV